MKEDDNVGDYCVRVKDVVNEMATLGEILKIEVVGKKVLISLYPKWNYIAIIIEQRFVYTCICLVGFLMSHEETLRERVKRNCGKAFISNLNCSMNDEDGPNTSTQAQVRGRNHKFSRAR